MVAFNHPAMMRHASNKVGTRQAMTMVVSTEASHPPPLNNVKRETFVLYHSLPGLRSKRLQQACDSFDADLPITARITAGLAQQFRYHNKNTKQIHVCHFSHDPPLCAHPVTIHSLTL